MSRGMCGCGMVKTEIPKNTTGVGYVGPHVTERPNGMLDKKVYFFHR